MATLQPKRTDNITPQCLAAVGKRLALEFGWTIADGRYAGQVAWFPTLMQTIQTPGIGWIPTEDLASIVEVRHACVMPDWA